MKTSQGIQFSEFRANEFERLCQLLSSIFQTSCEELAETYQNIRSTFEEDGWPLHFTNRDFFQSQDSHFQKICQDSPSIAVDLPSILELRNGDQNKPTIAVLGQDPKSGQSHKQISVGTPYGLHHKGSRECLKTTKLYFEMIQVLMRAGYRVYLTDLFKTWVCDPQRPYYGIKLPQVDRGRFLGILESELMLTKPVAVVSWGKPSENTAREIVEKLEIGLHLNFPHPSGAANGTWKKLMGKPPSYANKLAYWESSVKQALCNHFIP